MPREPSKYQKLTDLFGDAVGDIKSAFFNLDKTALELLLTAYGKRYRENAERYARKTFHSWRTRTIELSGQTMERLIELVPPHLTAEQRYNLLTVLVKKHKPKGLHRAIQIRLDDPDPGLVELTNAIDSMKVNDKLANLTKRVMKAAHWLYDDDITAARAMIAAVTRHETDLILSNVIRDAALIRTAIQSGKVDQAGYHIELPAGSITVTTLKPGIFATIAKGLKSLKL